MKKFLSLIFSICFIAHFTWAQENWSTLKTGAGGWITGMDIHPDGTLYIRSDVGGGYRLDPDNDTWKQIVTKQSMPANEVHWSKYDGILSIGAAASSPSKVYMAYNDGIFVSDNKGENWQKTNMSALDMDPNSDESKLFGERLVVDPNNENKVYFGSIGDGLFVTEDGMNWQSISNFPKGAEYRGVRSIVFDEESGTIGGQTQNIYVAVDGEGIYQSVDAGNSFSEITSGLFSNGDPWIYDMEIDINGNLYISGKDAQADGSYTSIGLYKYDGSDWQQVFSDDLSIPFSEIAIDPRDPSRVLIFSEGYSETYITRNSNNNNPDWASIGIQRSANNIPWLAWTETEWFTLGEIEFDPNIEDRIWITFGTGTYYIDEDGSNTLIWNEFSKGQEHLVSNDAVSFSNGNSMTAHWDFPIFLHAPTNNYPSIHGPSSRFNSCWDLSQSPTDENFVVALVEDIRYCCFDENTRSSGYTEDGGLSWTKFESMPEGEFDLIFGQIEVSAQNSNNIIWLPGDYRNPFVSLDKGASWNEVTLPGSSEDCCLSGPWFKRKALAADKVKEGKFYIYDWGSGDIFVTEDGGNNWDRKNGVLPAWSFHGKLIAAQENEGHLFFSNGPEDNEALIEGLMRSTDGGESWEELPGTNKILNVSVGKAAPQSNYPTVYICGEVNGEYGYFASTNNCASWNKIGEYPTGIYDWPTVMEANPFTYGNLKIGFKGNGFVEFNAEQNNDPITTERIHIDQFGYKPSFTKVAVISNPQIGFNSNENYEPGPVLQVIDTENGMVVYSGAPTVWNNGETHDQSGDKGWHFDFSALSNSGSYYIYDEVNNTKSYTFEISQTVYDEVLKTATKMFYYNRCNMAKEFPFAEANWTDGNNFPQDENVRFIYDQENTSLEKDMRGGWFDAGDYNKYVTFAHGAVHNLLSAYDEHPEVFGDNWNIPESGNGIADLLDEVTWELQWLEKMMNEDGSVYIKMGSRNFSENVSSPPSANSDTRYYGPECSAGSIAVASMFSHAALTFQSVNSLSGYADILKDKAVTAFDYYLQKLNTNNLDTECDDGSIVAGDADWDETKQRQTALIAAVYLFDLTGESRYSDYVASNVTDAEAVQGGWMGPYHNETMEALFYYSTLNDANQSTQNQIIDAVFPHVSQDWDGFYGQNNQDLYRAFIPEWSYHWGSNQVKADYANLNTMIAKYNINPSTNASYRKKAEEMIHYYHGVNPLTKVYLSNMGSRGAENSVDEIYHSWFDDNSEFDNVQTSLYGPAPGFIPGGPNQYYSFDGNSPPYGQPVQKSYKDFNTGYPESSWEITEPAIYYQAAYVRMLAAFASGNFVVPIVISDFNVERIDDAALLTWSSNNSINIEKFEIEVSGSTDSFEKIGEVNATEDSNSIVPYSYTDTSISNYDLEVIYYRLKIIDTQGNVEYSEVKSILLTKNNELNLKEVKIYPNPVSSTMLIETNVDEVTKIKIYNSLGSELMNHIIDQNSIELDVSNLTPGAYLVKLQIGNQSIKKIFIKT